VDQGEELPLGVDLVFSSQGEAAHAFVTSFPAAAEVFAPRLLAAIGEDRSFKSAQAMQC
jgi:hypothetical protein